MARRHRRAARGALSGFGALTLAALVLASAMTPQPANLGHTASRGPLAVPSVSRWGVAPGGQVTVTGHGFRPWSRVGISEVGPADGPPIVLVAGPSGKATVALVIAAEAKPGWRAVVLGGTGADGRPLSEEVGVEVEP